MQFFLPKRLEVRFSSRLVSSPPRALIFNIPASERFPSMTQSRMLSTSALLTFGARATFAALRVVGLSAAPLTLPTRCPQRFPPPVPPAMSQDTVKCPLGRAWNKSPTAKNCFPSKVYPEGYRFLSLPFGLFPQTWHSQRLTSG